MLMVGGVSRFDEGLADSRGCGCYRRWRGMKLRERFEEKGMLGAGEVVAGRWGLGITITVKFT